MRYCESIYKTQRWITKEVRVGNVGVGGSNPIRIQSMTTSNTRDVAATIEQIIRLADVGCEIVRVTVQGMKEAEACEGIKNGLIQRGYTIPLVADIHFFPPAAMRVVDFVDKVRINPGNFVDKRATFKTLEYDDLSYALEIEKIEEKFSPLVEKCKKLRRAIRIGTNHGSLSDRIMNRYGDTPKGMVESALEFARVCRHLDFHDIIFSMKASNPQVMILAYRLLVSEMMNLGWNYPLHLGVTEAGEGEDGRVKSAMGIGSLLLDGLGDTIRVSLTEDPWYEIDPCQRLVNLAQQAKVKGVEPFSELHRNITSIQRRQVFISSQTPLHRDGSALAEVTLGDIQKTDFFKSVGCRIENGELKLQKSTLDAIIIRKLPKDKESIDKLQSLQAVGIGIITPEPFEKAITLITLSDATTYVNDKARERLFLHNLHKERDGIGVEVRDEKPSEWQNLAVLKPSFILYSPSKNLFHGTRCFMEWVKNNNLNCPVILKFNYVCEPEDLIIHVSAEMGALLCDGLAEGLCVDAAINVNDRRTLAFNILQAARMRTFKTDFISCPSCGRTLFNLQEVSERIRLRTGHLPGVKVAIMGCIVNGPGEMADAHFGYVGSKPGKVDLYIGKQRVEADIEFSEADERLVQLIKSQGYWIEPDSAE